MTTPLDIQKQIKFNLDRMRPADEEMAAIAALRCKLWRDTLSEVQRYVEAKLAEDKQAQAVAE